MVAVWLWIYGVLDVLFWKWLHQNHLGANMKGLVIQALCHLFISLILLFVYIVEQFSSDCHVPFGFSIICIHICDLTWNINYWHTHYMLQVQLKWSYHVIPLQDLLLFHIMWIFLLPVSLAWLVCGLGALCTTFLPSTLYMLQVELKCQC